MAEVTLKIKIDLPGLQEQLNTAVNNIIAKLNAVGKLDLKFDGAKEGAAAVGSEVEKVGEKAAGTREKLSQWGMIITGLRESFMLVKDVVSELNESVLAGTGLEVLRGEFKGSTEDLELFRKATAGTVSEANLIKLSNQSSDLGISLEQQAIFFSLAENAADKYGGGVEAGMGRIISASEGSTRALKSLGIQKEVYEETVTSLAKAQGTTIDKLDAESQKQIRLQAIIQASGLTLEDVKNKVQDSNDKWSSLGVRIDESKEKFGVFISDALMPMLDAVTGNNEAMETLVGAMSAAFTTVVPLIPMIVQYKASMGLLAYESAAAAKGIDAVTFSTKGLFSIIAIGLAAGVGFGMLIDFLKDKHQEALQDSTAFNQRLAENGQKLAAANFMDSRRFIPGEGFQKVKKTYTEITEEINKLNTEMLKVDKGTKEYDNLNNKLKELVKNIPVQETADTVDDIKNKIQALNLKIGGTVAGSKEWLAISKEIAAAQSSISYDTSANDKKLQEEQKYQDTRRQLEADTNEFMRDEAERTTKDITGKVKSLAKIKIATEEELQSRLIDAMKDGKAKEMAALDMWLQTELDKYKDTEVRKDEAVNSVYEQFRQHKAEIDDRYTQEEKQKIESITQTYMQHFQVLLDSIQQNFNYQEQYSQADVDLANYEYKQKLEALKEQLKNGEITQEEYRLQERVAVEQHNKYLQQVEEDRQSAVQKIAKDVKDYLVKQLIQYAAEYVVRKAVEAATYSAAETEKTTSLAVQSGVRLGIAATNAVATEQVVGGTMAAIAVKAAPAATLTSIASFGANTVVAIAAILGAMATIAALVSGGFKEGGYTGDGPENKEAGVVHKGEYVFPADLVKNNKDKFAFIHHALQSGMTLDEIFRAANPQLDPYRFTRINLDAPELRISQQSGSQTSELTSLLKSLNEQLRKPAQPVDVKVVVDKVEVSGRKLYITLKQEEKVQKKVMASKEVS